MKVERTSFCEQKEAKKLYLFCAGLFERRAKPSRSFWFFFSKKNSLLGSSFVRR
jgi:hypothetical protein